MKQLKMKSLKSSILSSIPLLLLGCGLLYFIVPSLLIAIKGPIDINAVNFNGSIDGLYVSGDLYGIYDWYCEETENGKTVNREYIIDAGSDYYMGMQVMKKDMPAAEKLMEASYDYLNDLDDGTALEAAQYKITGTIHHMPADSLHWYRKYFDSSWDESIFLPYYLAVNKAGEYDISGLYVMLSLSLCFLAFAAFMIISALLGRGQKRIKNYIKNSSNPVTTEEKINYFIENTSTVNGLQYNRDFICGQNHGKTTFGETAKLVWAYLHTTTHKRNFITVGKTHELILAFADGSRQSVAMKSEEAVQEHLKTLSTLCPYAIIGYSDDLDRMFRKDFLQFLTLKYNNPENQQVS